MKPGDTRKLLKGVVARGGAESIGAEKPGPLDAPAARPGIAGLDDLVPRHIVPPGDTPEQSAVIEAGGAAVRLIADPRYRQAHAAMIAFRQGYAVAYRELQTLLAAEPAGAVPEMTESLLVDSAAWEASKPFSEHTLMRGMIETVLPWMATAVDAHSARDERAIRQEREEDEQARRVRPVPIGLDWVGLPGGLESGDAGGPELGRDRGLVLAGWKPALLWLADRATAAALAGTPAATVVRFFAAAPHREASRHLVRLARKQWEGCCNDNNGLARAMGRHAYQQLPAPPDLLVCDDMAAAYTRSYLGRPTGATAGDAHKKFSRWCGEAGCAFLGLVPRDDREPFEVRTPEFEQLRTFAHLRRVDVADDGDGNYLISIGAGAAVAAPKTEVDSHGRTVIRG